MPTGTRKVQKVGKSTFTVSLPQEWVKKNRVQAQTEVDIQTLSDGNLKIATMDNAKGVSQNREISIATKESDAGYLVREALAAYIANYDIIKLDLTGLTLDPTARNKIRRMIKYKMAGGEIIGSRSITSRYRSCSALRVPVGQASHEDGDYGQGYALGHIQGNRQEGQKHPQGCDGEGRGCRQALLHG
jgi:hypothetical protein